MNQNMILAQPSILFLLGFIVQIVYCWDPLHNVATARSEYLIPTSTRALNLPWILNNSTTVQSLVQPTPSIVINREVQLVCTLSTLDATKGYIYVLEFHNLNYTLPQSQMNNSSNSNNTLSASISQLYHASIGDMARLELEFTALDPEHIFCPQRTNNSSCYLGVFFCLNLQEMPQNCPNNSSTQKVQFASATSRQCKDTTPSPAYRSASSTRTRPPQSTKSLLEFDQDIPSSSVQHLSLNLSFLIVFLFL
jgi:hypothetical protein